MAESDKIGLDTNEALHRLYKAIKLELNASQSSRSLSSSVRSWLRDAYCHSSVYTSFCWTSALMMLIELLGILLYYNYGSERFRSKSMAIEIFVVILFLIFNLWLVGWDNRLRHSEMYSKAKNMLLKIEECKRKQLWDIGQYAHLHTPQSPCISTQWTYRDSHLVNLPCHLLVEGDVIVMRPGHISPGKCKSINKQFEAPVILTRGKVFAPVDSYSKKDFSSPQLRKSAKPAKFLMLETPYIQNFRLALNDSLKRPVSLFNRERHTVSFHYLERVIIPAILIVTSCIGVLHAAYFTEKADDSMEQLFLHPALAILPLLPLMLPLYWISLNAYGTARLLAIVEITKQNVPIRILEDREELCPITITKTVSHGELKRYFLALLTGKKGYIWRSSNLLQVLGSITALCCVDKKGILSWPNPTAEKLFFLKPSRSKSNSQDNSYVCGSSNGNGESPEIDGGCGETTEHKKMKVPKRPDVKDHIYHPSSQVEVLDLTHNVNRPFGIQFDDPNWKAYIGNLKPLGLAILLNTCNLKSQDHYTQFSDHIACESLHNDAAVPVVNKRCLCELAKQIGFTSSVVDFYELQQQVGLFRHVHPEVVQKGRLARSLNFPRLKMPFPNMSCAVVKDLHRGSHQLFSQGTADLILDACNEYWDGEDICTLTDSDRKRILDFYHRSSLTAHCMSYAYGPMNIPVTRHLPESYLELPPDGSDHFPSSRSVVISARSWDVQTCTSSEKYHNRCLSNDSLMILDQCEQQSSSCDSTNYCLEQIGNEIFVGMVTMQYQACPDFVELIELLDKACIRFVHFSKENELRSRVFSEKMGLESGWNCHISLLNETKPWKNLLSSEMSHKCIRKLSAFPAAFASSDRVNGCNDLPARCMSAPSIVNLDMTVVKFDDEVSTRSKSNASMLPLNYNAERDVESSEQGASNAECEIVNRESLCSIPNTFVEDFHHSPSHITESTDQSAPVTFDMSNRAKLPKGTENIRPHIENVDNVPLQVSLFTDCTAEATREMICIMQEYGEVVCCLGSSANCENMSIFLQADASLAIEPLHPQLCMQQPVFRSPSKKQACMGPMDLSCLLNSLPCSLNFHREDPISLFHLIMEARHFMGNMRNSFLFFLCCCLSLSLLQILASVFFLPLPLPLAHLLWYTCLIIPLLSLSLMGNPVESDVTTVATGKNLKALSKQTIMFFMACCCAKFCPSVILTLFCFICMVASVCSTFYTDTSDSCWIFTNVSKHSNHFIHKESWPVGLMVTQNVISFFIVIYFILISMGFIHRSHLLWNGSPFTNKYWTIAVPLVIVLQFVFIVIDMSIQSIESVDSLSFLKGIPFYVWLLGFMWPLILVPVNELVKRHEIKMNVRHQKKARLEFCTKLGMNSPF